MSDEQTDTHSPDAPQRAAAGRPEPAAPAAPDERDLAIERLERTLAEEREHAATLRTLVEELRFKNEILEKSYSKQLADARERMAAAEQALSDRVARIAELEGECERATRSLSEARAALEQFSGLGHAPGSRIETIEELMQDTSRMRRPPEAIRENGQLDLKIDADQQDGPSEDMLAPELLFAGRNRRDD